MIDMYLLAQNLKQILKCEYSDVILICILAFCTEPGVTYFVVEYTTASRFPGTFNVATFVTFFAFHQIRWAILVITIHCKTFRPIQVANMAHRR